MQEKKKKKNERVGKNFHWEHMGQENSVKIADLLID